MKILHIYVYIHDLIFLYFGIFTIQVKVSSEKAEFEEGVDIMKVVKEMDEDVKRENNGGVAARIVKDMSVIRVRGVRYASKKRREEDIHITFSQDQLEEAASMVSKDLKKSNR